MARPRKNSPNPNTQELALVPVEEQPYPLPEGWKWVYLKSGYDVTSSKRIHKSDWRDSGIPFYRTRELVKLSNNGFVDNELYIEEQLYDSIKKNFDVPKINDILISGVGTIGVPYIVNDNRKFYFKDGNIIWLKNKNIFSSKFTFYLFKSPFIDNQIHEMSAGTTVDTYTIINANKTKLPLPPLDEQERIVTRIESLFAKLDEAKEKAEAVLDSYETRKAAILHKAFTGELTAKWREKRGIEYLSGTVKVKDVLADIKYGTSEKSDYSYSGLPVIRIPNIAEGKVDLGDLKFLNSSTLSDYDLVKTDDILMIRSNGSRELVGKCALIDEISTGKAYASFLIRLRPKPNVSAKFLLAFLNSSDARSQLFAKAKSSAGINNINSKEISAVDIWLPAKGEQQEITRILDSLLEKEQQSKEAAEAVLEQIDLMKKAILAKAFRGELG